MSFNFMAAVTICGGSEEDLALDTLGLGCVKDP